MSAANPTAHAASQPDVSSNELYSKFNHVELPLGVDGTPFPYFEALRDVAATTPVGWSEAFGGFWVAAGYDVVREIMRRTDEFSADKMVWPSYNTGGGELIIAAQDEPEHRMYRALVQSDFSPKAASEYQGLLERMTNDLIDSFIDQGSCDVSDALGDEVPARLTAIFLGLDQEEGATYRSWVHAMAAGETPDEDMNRLLGEMHVYFADTVARAKRDPGDDILSRLTQVQLDGRPLSDDELIAFGLLLLIGGIHNSAKLFSNAFWRLGWDPELRRRLVARPEMIPSAVEEFLRFYSPGIVGRSVREDAAEVGGVTMSKGDVVMLAIPVANRDPRQFEHPDVFIPDREPNKHVGLGHGLHACLGGSLIRLEAKIMFTEFLKRIPEFELDQSEKRPYWQTGQVGGMTDVVLKFPPGGGGTR